MTEVLVCWPEFQTSKRFFLLFILTFKKKIAIWLLTSISTTKKKACTDKDPKSKPDFLSEKSLEPTFKQIVKKFPNFEKGTSVNLTFLNKKFKLQFNFNHNKTKVAIQRATGV